MITQSTWENTRIVNGRQWTRRLVGYVVWTESHETTIYGEYAADNTVVEVPAGRYPIYALREGGHRWHSLSCSIDAVVTSEANWNGKQPGDAMRYTYSPYPHQIAKAIVDGEQCCVELAADVTAKPVDFEYDGEQRRTYKLVFDNGDEC